MSIARVHTTKKSRKVWTCGSCRTELPIGSPVISFSVGFRGSEQRRCLKPECYPTRSQLESSAVSTVYAAIEENNVDSATTYEELIAIRDAIVEACEEVASEYESNEMYDINYDLQERAETIRSAGDDLSTWEPDSEEPDIAEEGEGDDEDGEPVGESAESHDDWLEEARESLRDAIENIDLP